MPNRVVVITGCQRSGTTMLNLALDAHPDVVGIDEMQFDAKRVADYLNDPEFGPVVCFKLPTMAAGIGFLKGLGRPKVVWMVRDPRAVVASMMQLPLYLGGQVVPWAAHPGGAQQELRSCLRLFGGVPADLGAVVERFAADAGATPPPWPKDLLATSAALVWRLKNEILPHYAGAGIEHRAQVYERLVAEPRAEMAEVLTFLGLKWHDDVLRHHELHSEGRSVGLTDNTRAIDRASLDKWKDYLEPSQVEIVRAICGPRAEALGYRL
jgi:hypothetical protein